MSQVKETSGFSLQNLIQLEKLLAGVRKLSKCQWRVEVYFPAKRAHHLLPVVPAARSYTHTTPPLLSPIREDAAGGNEAVDGVSHRSHQDPELVPTVDVLLLHAQYDGAQVLVVGEVVPVFSAVEVLLISGLNHTG